MITPWQIQRDLVQVREAELARRARPSAQLAELRESADHQSRRHHYLDYIRDASHDLAAFAVRRSRTGSGRADRHYSLRHPLPRLLAMICLSMACGETLT